MASHEDVLGFWQRKDLPYYSGLIRVSFKEQAFFVDLISAGKELDQPLRVTPLLKVVIEKNR